MIFPPNCPWPRWPWTALALGGGLLCAPALAEPASTGAQGPPPAPEDRGDTYSLYADSTTVVSVFQRALQPGPAGARITTETLAPVHEYVLLRLRDVDVPWAADSVDVELSAWGSAGPTDPRYERPADGDVTVAQVTHRFGPGSVKIGRQIVTAGAARFAHFDGLTLDARSEVSGGFGAGGTAYGGFTVLPYWSDRPGYAHLGASFDTLVDSPEAFEDPSRSGNTMVGGRLFGWYADLAELGLSLHDERTHSELGRRDAALDALATPTDELDLSLRTLLDLDTFRLSEALAAATVYPTDKLDVTLQYRRATPVLLMSRQSVLGVFAADKFDEFGTHARYRATQRLAFDGSSHVELFREADAGVRASVSATAIPDPLRQVTIQVGVTRVVVPENGYFALRLSGRYRPWQRLSLVGEQYVYVYDAAILGRATSAVESLNAQYSLLEGLELLVGGSAFQTPYASNDTQALVKLEYRVDRLQGAQP